MDCEHPAQRPDGQRCPLGGSRRAERRCSFLRTLGCRVRWWPRDSAARPPGAPISDPPPLQQLGGVLLTRVDPGLEAWATDPAPPGDWAAQGANRQGEQVASRVPTVVLRGPLRRGGDDIVAERTAFERTAARDEPTGEDVSAREQLAGNPGIGHVRSTADHPSAEGDLQRFRDGERRAFGYHPAIRSARHCAGSALGGAATITEL